jgi:predicted transcriptional regulator
MSLIIWSDQAFLKHQEITQTLMNSQDQENTIILLRSFKEKDVQLWEPKQEKVHTKSMLHQVLENTS